MLSGLARDPGLTASLALALLLCLASTTYFAHAGLTTAFSDARARLMIARAVLDGRHAGLAQLGGIWPPFPQAYMLPFIWNDTLFYSGMAGAIPSAICYLGSSAFLYKLLSRLTLDPMAGVIGVVAFSGPNVLYLQSVPMSELPFIVCFLGAVYFTVRWMLRGSLGQLFLAGLMTCLSTLTRYEGWVMVGLLTVVVVFFCWRAGHRYEEIEGILLLFGLMAFLGIALWLLWNRVIFGDTLYFLHSQYGTTAINNLQLQATPAQARPAGNLALSVQVFGWAALDNIGVIACGVAILGLGRLAVARRLRPATVTAALILLFPFLFSVVATYFGAEVITDPHATPGLGLTNVRYGILLAPAAGFLAGWLAKGQWTRWPVLAASVASSLLVWNGGLVNVDDAIAPLTGEARTAVQSGEWLRNHYDTGLVLIQRRTNEHVLFASKIPLSQVVYEGDRGEWSVDLTNPGREIRWIVADAGYPSSGTPPDAVWVVLNRNPELLADYELAYENGPIRVYRSLSP